MDDSEKPMESGVMALFEQIIFECEHAQSLIQDDSLITGEQDRRSIMSHVMKIRYLSKQIDITLGSKIL